MEKKNKTRTNKIKSRGRKDIDIIQMLKALDELNMFGD